MSTFGMERVSEYRIVLPMDMEEFRTGHLWSIAEASKNETGGGEGIEFVTNEPFKESPEAAQRRGISTSGQYTHKIFYLKQKVPPFVRLLAPTGSLEIHEKSWNGFPRTRTEYSNTYLGDEFHLIIESVYAPDRGTTENIHNLSDSDLAKRVVDNIDIANDRIAPIDYKAEFDPCKVRSEKADRGPLPMDGDGSWKTSVNPVMCCYKLYRVKFDWIGLKVKMESIILKAVRRLLSDFHRQLICWMDNYHGLTMDEVRKFEYKTKEDLEVLRHSPDIRGMVEK